MLDLVADFLQSVETEEGIGLGRGTLLGPLLADVAFSYVDRNWPEIGVRHRLQPCYQHPWVTRPAPQTELEPWMYEWFGDLSRFQVAQETPRPRKAHRSAQENHGGIHTKATGSVNRTQVPVPIEIPGDRPPCPLMTQTRSESRDRGSGPNLSIYIRYGDDFLLAGMRGPERAASGLFWSVVRRSVCTDGGVGERSHARSG
jgi:hypothetical protein